MTVTGQNMAHEQIIVHRLRNNLSNGRCFDLPVLMQFRYTQDERSVPEPTRYLSERGEVSTHLILIEIMENPAQMNYYILFQYLGRA